MSFSRFIFDIILIVFSFLFLVFVFIASYIIHCKQPVRASSSLVMPVLLFFCLLYSDKVCA